MRKILSRILIKIANVIYEPSWEEIQKRRSFTWNEVNGAKTLRLDYDLNENSLVFDISGYSGQWAGEIFSRYNCSLCIFEPIKKFCDKIKERFYDNDKIIVYNFGLGGENRDEDVVFDESATFIFRYAGLHNKNNRRITIKIKKASDYIKEPIDLMKINIEGGEYELLEHLIEAGLIRNIKNIQVQFHDFVPNALERMQNIQKELKKTHHLTYQYLFVFENWEINK